MRAALPIAIVLLLLPAAARAGGDEWLGADKALHFAASAEIALWGYGVGALVFERTPPRLAVGAGLALGAGAGKEIWDRRAGGDPSWRDFAWDVAGAATGLLTAWIVDTLMHTQRRSLRWS